ncbi:MAG: polysaccharide biosynthesis/export family protein [Tannerellaceae bacterium]|nr:polysaccharide biosynthesis/export family protein [Tannerellaceae bacterium]
MNKRIQLAAWYVISIILLASCSTAKDIVYLQDAIPFQSQVIEQNYEAVIHKDDLLSIMVNSRNPELALPFNMPLISYQIGVEGPGTQRVLGYQVDKKGNIDFPLLGKLHVEGLTRVQLTERIKAKLISEDYIQDPIVTVQFLNFKVSVLGEVAHPGSFTINSDRVTLFEALSMAGDMTIFGRRDRVMVIREKDNQRIIYYNNLLGSEVFDSPSYYLEQNDIVYVEPNTVKAGQSRINQNNSVGVWVSVLSLVTTIAVLIFK